MPRRLDSGQLSLFTTDLRDLAESIGLDWWAAKKLYDDGWLSFDPEINTINDSSKEAEFVFLGRLVAAGCDQRMLKQLLETLEKPYYYHLYGMYYDWAKRCWMDHELPPQDAAKIVSEFEDDSDAASLEELKELAQEAINRLNGDEGVPCDQYDFNAEQDTIVAAGCRLLWKIAASALVDTPSKTIVVGKLFRVFQNLPKITLDEHLSISLVGPRRMYGEHEIWHYWDIELNEEGYLKISSAGHFYRPQTGGDSFTSMTWEVSPACAPELNDYLHNLLIVDDADTFENEVEAMDLESGGYKLTVEDPTLEALEEDEEDESQKEEVKEFSILSKEQQLERAYQIDADKEVARRIRNEIVDKTISELEGFGDGYLLSGDDSGLQSVWEEICVQVQGEQSLDWDAYVDTFENLLRGFVDDLSSTERIAIWLSTEAGTDWIDDQQDGSNEDDTPPVTDDDIVEELKSNLLSRAGEYSNKRIERFINNLHGYDDDEEGEENNMDEDNNADEATNAAAPWVLLPCDEADRRLAARIDHSEVDKREEQFAYGAEVCDFCKCDLGKRGLFVDGKVRNKIEWANMCAPCFEKNGDGIGWGVGQLYALQPNGDRRLVAGFDK